MVLRARHPIEVVRRAQDPGLFSSVRVSVPVGIVQVGQIGYLEICGTATRRRVDDQHNAPTGNRRATDAKLKRRSYHEAVLLTLDT